MKAARRISTVFFKKGDKSPKNGGGGDGAILEGEEEDLRKGWLVKKTIDGIDYFYKPETGEVTWEDPADRSDADSFTYSWVPHPTDVWQPAKVLSKEKDGSTTCESLDGKKIVVPASGKMKSAAETGGRDQTVPLWALQKNDLMHIEDDLIMLENVNEGSIVYNLSHKYRKTSLYTWVGASKRILISINPYQRLPLYGDEQIAEHADSSPNRDISPHIFDIADGAYREMLFEAKTQSILISGESGAGKTEATKQCLKFWAKVAGSKNGVEDKLIQANPVLEAFGNAKTIRNNNSSRFGKWMEVYFSLKDRYIEGASITNFLLEKSRLAYQQSGERNFHIFYQLLSDASKRQQYELEEVSKNRYLQRGLTTSIPGIDDAGDFKDMLQAMKDVGFSAEDQDFLLRIPAAILHLGNVTFLVDNQSGGVTGSKIENDKQLELASRFFQVDKEQLRKPMLSRTITVRGEVSVIPLDPEQARAQCDSIAKGFYSRMFDWLVSKVNLHLQSESTSGKIIGVLDIFGFEIFDVNSFEQLCINFCNEKLQQLFNIETFHDEEKLYSEEGVPFAHISINDSEPVLTMIEKGPDGLLPTLDDECKLEGDDVKYLNRITQKFESHPKFQVDKRRKMGDVLAFEIVHYAGVVNYTTSEFKLKNKDTFAQEAYDLGANSSDEILKSLFPKLTDKMQSKTLSLIFRTQLNVLMEKLHKTSTRYVRCVKPNESMAPMLFEAPLVLRQLRYSGVFEAVEIRKQGYPFRFKYEVFAIRFACINPDHVYASKSDNKDKVQEIFRTSPNFKAIQDQIVFGKTMVFYKAPVYKLLKLLRNLALEIIVPRVAGIMRGNLARWFRKFMTRAEVELKAAFDTLTNQQAMKDALSHVDGHLGSLARVFPLSRPRFEQDCKERIVWLQRCLDEEVKVNALLQANDPNGSWQVWTEQKWVLDSLDHVPKTPTQIASFDKLKHDLATCEVQLLDNKSIEMRRVMDKVGLEECSAASVKWKHTSPAIEEVKRVLALPEVNFMELEFIAARGDAPRVAALCARWFGNVGGTTATSVERAKSLVQILDV